MSLRQFESELVQEKHWTLRGEVNANDRPTDSLLAEGAIEFNLAGRTAQNDEALAISKSNESITFDLEAQLGTIIKKRVGLQLWDDVKARTVIDAPASTAKLSEVLEEVGVQKNAGKTLVEEYSDLHVTKTGASVNVQNTEVEAEALWVRLERKLNQYCTV